MSEGQDLKEYKQGDEVRLTVEVRDTTGVDRVDAFTFFEGTNDDSDPYTTLDLSGWPEANPTEATVLLTGMVQQQRPGVYECFAIVAGNPYRALTRHDLDPPLRFRIVEHPDDVRKGPEVLSVGDFW